MRALLHSDGSSAKAPGLGVRRGAGEVVVHLLVVAGLSGLQEALELRGVLALQQPDLAAVRVS